MQEFYTTERQYVEALQLLVEVSDSASRYLIKSVRKIIALSITVTAGQSPAVPDEYTFTCNSAFRHNQWNSLSADFFCCGVESASVG